MSQNKNFITLALSGVGFYLVYSQMSETRNNKNNLYKNQRSVNYNRKRYTELASKNNTKSTIIRSDKKIYDRVKKAGPIQKI